jgi:hypothetical protein
MAARHITSFANNTDAAIVGGVDHAFDLVGDLAIADDGRGHWLVRLRQCRAHASSSLLLNALAAEVRNDKPDALRFYGGAASAARGTTGAIEDARRRLTSTLPAVGVYGIPHAG